MFSWETFLIGVSSVRGVILTFYQVFTRSKKKKKKMPIVTTAVPVPPVPLLVQQQLLQQQQQQQQPTAQPQIQPATDVSEASAGGWLKFTTKSTVDRLTGLSG